MLAKQQIYKQTCIFQDPVIQISDIYYYVAAFM